MDRHIAALLLTLAAAATADESCEGSLLQSRHKAALETGPLTINQTEAEAVTSCAEGTDCGSGGCRFGLFKYAKDYECVYLVWWPLPKATEVFFCHDGKLVKCGTEPEATCVDFQTPNPCEMTTTTTTSTTTTPTTTSTTTTAPPDVMLWKTEFNNEKACLAVDGKNVVGAPCNGLDAQIWELTAEGQIVLTKSKLCLTAVPALAANASDNSEHLNIELSVCDSGMEEQLFRQVDDSADSASVLLKLKNDDGLCLDWDVGGLYSTNNVYLYDCNGQTNQRWLSVPETAQYQVSFKGEVRCLSFTESDVLDVVAKPCGEAPLWTWSFASSQLWTVQAGKAEKLCLTARTFSQYPTVVLSPCVGSDRQQFRLNPDTTMNLLDPEQQSLCMDWDVAGTIQQDNVYMFLCNGETNQKWRPLLP